MASILKKAYEGVTSTLSASYNIASSVISSATSGPLILTFGLVPVNMGTSRLARAVSALSGGRFQLNNFVPQFFRSFCRKAVGGLVKTNQKLSRLIAAVLRMDSKVCSSVFVAPVMEELTFRLPLLIASSTIDMIPFEMIISPLLEDVVNLTGGQALKCALCVISSIAFTYAHDNNPNPGRAAGVFTSGLVLSYLTLRPGGGLVNAMVAHAIHNIVVTLMNKLGLETDIVSISIQEDLVEKPT